jgi:hypothetical protein
MLDSRERPGEWGVGAICCRRRNGLTPRGVKAIIASAPLNRNLEGPKLDDKLHSMLRELRRALSEAISESSEINRTLRKIREEGYSLYLLVDCKREIDDPKAVALTAPRWPSSGEPAFQIDVRDLNFLKSIGIDPTRRLRRRKVTS